MRRILALVDHSVYADSVVDHAAWFAATNHSSIDVVHVIDPLDPAAVSVGMAGLTVGGPGILNGNANYSEEKLQDLTMAAEVLVDRLTTRIKDAGLGTIVGRVIVGELNNVLATLQEEADLIVAGKRGEMADFVSLRLGSNLQKILRVAKRPVVIAPRSFRPIAGSLIALDDGPEMISAVGRLATNLIPAMPCEIVHVGDLDDLMTSDLELMRHRLSDAGHEVLMTVLSGDPVRVMAERLAAGDTRVAILGKFGRARMFPTLFGDGVGRDLTKASLGPMLVLSGGASGQAE